MLHFHVITLFPDLIQAYVSTSIIGRGIKAERLKVSVYNPRDFCTDKYRKVDDTPYGGGAGMVLKPEPIFKTLEAIPRAAGSPVILLTPQGTPFKQSAAARLANSCDITLICGHYEGFDERIRTLATEEISLGDYVLTGGELGALTVIDAVGRLVPGVVGTFESVLSESFQDGLLESPQYTKPAEYRGLEVPEVLRSGDHKAITLWRRQQSLKRTLRRRPDLIESAQLSAGEQAFIESCRDHEKDEA